SLEFLDRPAAREVAAAIGGNDRRDAPAVLLEFRRVGDLNVCNEIGSHVLILPQLSTKTETRKRDAPEIIVLPVHDLRAILLGGPDRGVQRDEVILARVCSTRGRSVCPLEQPPRALRRRRINERLTQPGIELCRVFARTDGMKVVV